MSILHGNPMFQGVLTVRGPLSAPAGRDFFLLGAVNEVLAVGPLRIIGWCGTSSPMSLGVGSVRRGILPLTSLVTSCRLSDSCLRLSFTISPGGETRFGRNRGRTLMRELLLRWMRTCWAV